MFKDSLVIYREYHEEGLICTEVLGLESYDSYKLSLIEDGYKVTEGMLGKKVIGGDDLEYLEHDEKGMVVLAKCIISKNAPIQKETVKSNW